MKTSRQIQGDIYRLLRHSGLYAEITGEVYRQGMRPRDSRKEDAIVAFTAGLPGQIQEGVVTVNIYVPDIDPRDDGVMVEDSERTEQLETLAQAWVDELKSPGYLFRLADTIHTTAEPSISQHIVVVRLRYRYGENDVY